MFYFQLSSFHRIAQMLHGAEKILLCMGYQRVSLQELKYDGEVDKERVIQTAVDLVILNADLELIGDLVLDVQQRNCQNVTFYDILKARSEPNDVLENTVTRSIRASFRRSEQPQVRPRAIPPQVVQKESEESSDLDSSTDSATSSDSEQTSAPSGQDEESDEAVEIGKSLVYLFLCTYIDPR